MRRQIYVTYAQCVTVKKLWANLKGKDELNAALERLDGLTKDERLSAVAQTLGIVHGTTANHGARSEML